MGSVRNATRTGSQGSAVLSTLPLKILDGPVRRRQDVLIQNISDQLIFIGLDEDVEVDGPKAGIVITPGSFIGIDAYIGPLYGITESGTAEVRYLEFWE